MRLIECYIDGFGCIVDKKFTFDDLNQIVEDNGYGKTTLATFLKVMFYGFDNKKKNSDRTHYLPFDSKKFGGSITFIHDNATYKIERSFSKKSSEDEMNVYKNNKLTTELTDIPGKALFNLDVESFLRSIYITSTDLEVTSTPQINAKLSNFIDNSEEDVNVEKIVSDLDSRYKKLTKSKGEIEQLKSNRNDLISQIKSIEVIKDGLVEKYSEADKIDAEVKAIEKEYTKARKINEAFLKWKDKASTESEIKSIEDKYGNLLVSNEIDNITEISNQINSLKNNFKSLSQKEQNLFDNLSSRYTQIPSEIQINEIDSLIHSLDKAKYQETLTSAEESLISKYDGINVNIGELERLVNEFSQKPIETTQPKTKDNTLTLKIIISMVITILGIGLGFINPLLFILSGVGILLAIVFWLVDMQKQINRNNKVEIDKYLEQENTKNKINAMFKVYNFDSEKYNDPSVSLNEFKKEYSSYLETKEKKDRITSINNLNDAKEKEDKEKISKFFECYGITLHNYKERLDIVRKEISKLDALTERINDITKENNKAQSEIESLMGIIEQFKSKYCIENLDNYIIELNKSKTLYNHHVSQLKKKEIELNNYLIEVGLTESLIVNGIDEEAIELRKKEASDNLRDLNDEIAEDEEKCNKLDDLNNRLALLEEEIANLEDKAKLYEYTKDALIKSQDTLKQKYINPVKASLQKYIEELKFDKLSNPLLDSDFELTYEDGSKTRQISYLSLGQMTIAMLCYRLALIDNIFDENQFLIIDDAFINLDKKNLEYTLSLVKKLSKNRQIIYFTCHDSRKII